jgi:hypothetical protein
MTDLPLTVTETSNRILVSWTPPVGCLGYALYVNDKRVSNSWNPELNHTRFAKVNGAVYKVVALGIHAQGVYPPAVPPNSEDYGEDPYSSAVYSH